MYKIGELSKLCNLPVKTLRYYDSEGLLVPDEIDRFTGYRYYSAARLADYNRIIALKEIGFTLDEIKRRMKADSTDEILTLLDAKKAEMKTVISQTESQLKRLNAVRQIITEGEKNMFDMIIRSTDTIRVAFTRKIYKTKEEAQKETERIKAALPKNILGQRTVIINYETEYREQDFDLAACVEITGKLPKGCGYEEKNIELPGDVASLVCRDNELEAAYRSMTRQLEEESCQIVGAFIEIFHDDGTVELKVPICRLSLESDKYVDDDINLPFVNDPEAIGKWKFLDKIPSAEQFCIDKPKHSDADNIWLRELYFLPEGKDYWIVRGWTKGSLTTSFNYPKHTFRHNYTIHTQNGKSLMFIEMKDDYYRISHGGKPEIYVFEKISDKEYKRDEIRIHDKVDYPFISDEQVLGKWISYDLCNTVDDFDPKHRFWKGNLYFKTVEFLSDGKAIEVMENNRPWTIDWTQGLLLDKGNEIAEAYEIKKIDGCEYLFIEWKSGDYVFGGRKPCRYIFTRA